MNFMTFEEYKKKYSLQLTDQQDRAVQTVNGPVLVLAVPGAGKTTVLVARLGYMLFCLGILPEEILTVTYTVAATKDMRRRFERMFGAEFSDAASRLEFRTINGICARVIADYGRRIGKDPFALQTDEGEILKLLRSLYIDAAGSFPTESETAELRSRVSYIKNMQLTGKELEKLEEEAGFPLAKIYQSYCEKMKHLGLMDYDDQMVYALNILTRCPELLSEYQARYRYLCVDEAQDTSKIQHRILKLLAGNGNLFMVGDEDQSIYGFRAAYPEALLSFEKDHPGAKVLLMEKNFRSDAAIVKAAGQLIAHNRLRHRKMMIPTREQNTKVRIFSVKQREDQYSYLVQTAKECAEKGGGTETTAVLYRNNESAVPLMDRLEREGISYNVRSADLSFFTSRVVYDVAAIYRFLQDPSDPELFLQIYYKLSLYVSKQMAEEACRLAGGMSLLTALWENPRTPEYVRKAIRELERHRNRILHGPALTAVQLIEGPLGYGAYLERMSLGRGKLDLLEFLAAGENTMEALFLRMQSLQTSIREKEYDPACSFILSTIHGSKGLEYDRVILMDVGDGVFPASLPAKGKRGREGKKELAAYEEERRIFYVGITRARNELTILKLPQGSEFAKELLPPRHAAVRSAKQTARQGDRNPDKVREFCEKVQQGQKRVIHSRYGCGDILVLDEKKNRVMVQFDDGMQKKLDLAIAVGSGLLELKR